MSEYVRKLDQAKEYREGICPILGTKAVFDCCREHYIQLATTSGFYREIFDLILDLTGVRDIFAANISSSDVKHGRPAPFMIFRAMESAGIDDVRQVLNIGDTPLDLLAGSNAGVRGVIGALTRAHGKERREREPHTHIIPSPPRPAAAGNSA